MTTEEFLSTLPAEANAHRVLRTAETAAFLGISVVHLRRLSRRGLVPSPIRLGERRLGWRLGDLVTWTKERQAPR